MSLNINYDIDVKTLTLILDGRFDFLALKEFQEYYDQIESKPEKYIIDLEKSTYIDSSVLGMLLSLKDGVNKDDKLAIILKKPSSVVKKILSVTKFDKVFTIE